MGYLACDLCDEPLEMRVDAPAHVCDRGALLANIEHLRKRANEAETNLDRVEDAVLKILQSLPEPMGETVTFKSDDLRNLWKAAECCWYEYKLADSFLSQWLSTHRVLIEAQDLFDSKNGSAMKRLEVLHEQCRAAYEHLGYHDSTWDVTPEQFAEELAAWFLSRFEIHCHDCQELILALKQRRLLRQKSPPPAQENRDG